MAKVERSDDRDYVEKHLPIKERPPVPPKPKDE